MLENGICLLSIPPFSPQHLYSTYQRNQEIVRCPVSSPFPSQLLDLQAGSTWLFIYATRGDISKCVSLNLEKLVAGEREQSPMAVLSSRKNLLELAGQNLPAEAALAHPGSQGGLEMPVMGRMGW